MCTKCAGVAHRKSLCCVSCVILRTFFFFITLHEWIIQILPCRYTTALPPWHHIHPHRQGIKLFFGAFIIKDKYINKPKVEGPYFWSPTILYFWEGRVANVDKNTREKKTLLSSTFHLYSPRLASCHAGLRPSSH